MSKRGFCAVCDARFDLLTELFIGEGPMRSLIVPQVAEMSKPPTSKMREVEPGHFILGEDPLIIGQGLGHSEEVMTWLARRLEKALREARK